MSETQGFELLKEVAWPRESGNLALQVGEGAVLPFVLAAGVAHQWEQGLGSVIVTEDATMRARIAREMRFFLPASIPVGEFPDWEVLPYDSFSPSKTIMAERLGLLGAWLSQEKKVVVVSMATLLQKVPPRHFLRTRWLAFQKGQPIVLEQFKKDLISAGYAAMPQVTGPGEWAARGSIVDVFPMGQQVPYRLNFWDDVIDSVRCFDPETQRSLPARDLGKAPLVLLPASEFPLDELSVRQFKRRWGDFFEGDPHGTQIYGAVLKGQSCPGMAFYAPLLFEQMESLFDYWPEATCVFKVGDLPTAARTCRVQFETRYEQRRHDARSPILPPSEWLLEESVRSHRLSTYPQVQLQVAHENGGFSSSRVRAKKVLSDPLPDLTLPMKKTRGQVEFWPALQKFFEQALPILCVVDSVGRRDNLKELLRHAGIAVVIFEKWSDFMIQAARSRDVRGLLVGPMEAGGWFKGLQASSLHQEWVILTETELLGRRPVGFSERLVHRRPRSETESVGIRHLAELEVGMPVVHFDHGVGLYRGLVPLTINQQIQEFLVVEYANEDRLYVPVTALNLVAPYSAGPAEGLKLAKLGGEEWTKHKQKAEKMVRDVAAELVQIYATRMTKVGLRCKTPDAEYEQFVAQFPFEETVDQSTAIQQVTHDLTSGHVMDRVICGDVGFGKTEVALRAAFLAVHSGFQVAILVPTTLLAQQHYETCLNRFAAFPVRVSVLSRFRGGASRQKALEAMEAGTLDIVVGTHQLLQKNVTFKNLGLLIIDEEHRFGVQHKERMKALRAQVHVLSLTATPIPRTLSLSFSGLRDLSIVATPPEERLPIKTWVRPYDVHLIQEAILREIQRGGQVYYVHNQVETIYAQADRLQQLMPQVKMAVAHGQMRERELEKTMLDFYHRRFQVLICTTIIETGLDISSVNTIIIERADKFGLAQLHQLRGRVGRSHYQAYAFCLVREEGGSLTPDAEKRLEALQQFEELGSGFLLAYHDLEIRGAGELLGASQSGHLESIGYSFYMDLLGKAVQSIKKGEILDLEASLRSVEIDLQIPAFIPADYVPDVNLRLVLYKRLHLLSSQEEQDRLREELMDRFGPLKEPVEVLLRLASLRLVLKPLGLKRVEWGSEGGWLEWYETPSFDPRKLIHLLQTQGQVYRLEGPQRLRVTVREVPCDKGTRKGEDLVALAEARIRRIQGVLQSLSAGS